MKALTTKQAASLIGVSHRTLQRWRLEGVGPRFTRIGSRIVRYNEDDIKNWMKENQHAKR